MAQGAGHLAAERALIDDIILPSETRDVILQTLERCAGMNQPAFKHRVDP
jgi:acetyl-CoA carboxylase carboxyltransferase component